MTHRRLLITLLDELIAPAGDSADLYARPSAVAW